MDQQTNLGRLSSLAAVALAGLGLAACVDDPSLGGSSDELRSDAIAAARQEALAVAAARPNERFLALAVNFDGVILFDPTFTEIALIAGAIDGNDWIRRNNDGTGTIHINDHDAFGFYTNFDTGESLSGSGGNLSMDFSGELFDFGGGHYYVFGASVYNFHGNVKVQPDGDPGGPTSTLILHSSNLNGHLNEFIRVN